MKTVITFFFLLLAGSAFAQQIREQPSKYPPLYVIDGKLYTGKNVSHSDSTLTIRSGRTLHIIPLSSLQSVHVLKDLEATKIYGHRGAYGAIQIVTKNPKK